MTTTGAIEKPQLPSYGRLFLFSFAITMTLATLFVVQMSTQLWVGASSSYMMPREFALNYIRNLFWAFTAPAVMLWTFRYPLERPHLGRNLLRHLAAYGVFTVAMAGYRTMWQILYFGFDDKTDTPWLVFKILLTLAFNSNIWMYMPAVVAAHMILYYRRVRERELQAEKLRTELSQAELHALRAQLHPHFLFNTLHSISALIRTAPQAADQMIMRLSDLLRITLENGGVQEVPLKTEIEVLENYLKIEQVRFQDRLRIQIHVEPEMLDARVPFLCLQPIAENSIRHGIAKLTVNGEITIVARPLDGRLEISIADNGPGFNGKPQGRGVGLGNIRARLERLYGADQSFEASNRPEGGAMVRMVIPLHIEPESQEGNAPELLRAT
jgi:two-component system, LytTR family, sensor kinase